MLGGGSNSFNFTRSGIINATWSTTRNKPPSTGPNDVPYGGVECHHNNISQHLLAHHPPLHSLDTTTPPRVFSTQPSSPPPPLHSHHSASRGASPHMAEVVAPRGKRARSPSPAYGGDTLASPLEVLLKRRRRGEWSAVGGSNNGAAAGANGSGVGGISTSGGGMFVPPPPPVWRPDPYAGGRGGHQHNNGGGSRDEGEMDHDASSSVAAMSSPLRHRRDDDDDMAESSTAWMRRAGIERRRQRAWEYLQNPTASAPGTASNASSSTATTGDATAMTQAPVSYMYSLSQPQGRIDSSPAAPSRYSRAHSASLPPPAAAQTPEPVAGAVSSSPVRHEPPSSTPFRGGSGDLDVWTEDERMREWGEEYSAQNSILYSLVSAGQAIERLCVLTLLIAPRTRRFRERSSHTSIRPVHPTPASFHDSDAHHAELAPVRPPPHTLPVRSAHPARDPRPRVEPVRVVAHPLLPRHRAACRTHAVPGPRWPRREVPA